MTKDKTQYLGRKDPLDKFYTKAGVAAEYISKINLDEYSTIIEPSAGNGAFSNLLPNCIALDLAPEGPDIIKQDWFTYEHNKKEGEKVLVIGNPPYGKRNSLSIPFINHAAKFADTVAFILPSSMRKESQKKRVDPYLHVIHEEDVPPSSFIFEGKPYSVPTVFQIWEKREEKRVNKYTGLISSNNLFTYVKRDEDHDLVLRATGDRAGQVYNGEGIDNIRNTPIKFHIPKTSLELEEIITKIDQLEHPAKYWAVKVPGLSKPEINEAINLAFTDERV